MSEKRLGQATLSRYASLKNKTPEEETQKFWWLPIARIYSGSEIYDYGLEKGKLKQGMVPAVVTSNHLGIREMQVLDRSAYQIAVRELIIEWDDYQTEFSGYIYCYSCEDQIDRSTWLDHPLKRDAIAQYETESKQLLRFVKQPGLKTTIVKVETPDLKFYSLDLNKCPIEREAKNAREIRREHRLECEIRSLFAQDDVLSIKNAHITVELIIKLNI